MIQKLLALAAIAGAAWWYWQGPYQDRVNPGYDVVLERNDEHMSQCLRGKAYRQGATGTGVSGDVARRQCAETYNVYFEDGHWHSYDMSRPE